jgi:lysophospholipase L1-like esterase
VRAAGRGAARAARATLRAALRAVLLAAALSAAAAPPGRPTLYLVGDSTMADKVDPEHNPERGWGQELPRFVDTLRLAVRNHAANGRSTKRFLDEGRWDSVMARVRPGDYVLVQFAHNDGHAPDPARYVNAHTGFRRNLERMVADARARGATPILASPVVRRYFNDAGVLADAHGAYGYVLRRVAVERRVAFVDLQLATEDLVASLGPERSKALYLWVAEGEFPRFPRAKQDNTHFRAAGAAAVARLAARGLAATGLPLARWVRAAGAQPDAPPNAPPGPPAR